MAVDLAVVVVVVVACLRLLFVIGAATALGVHVVVASLSSFDPPSLLPCFLASLLPCFLSFLPSSFLVSLLFLPSFLPSFPHSFLLSFLPSPSFLLPCFLPSSFLVSLLSSFLPSFLRFARFKKKKGIKVFLGKPKEKEMARNPPKSKEHAVFLGRAKKTYKKTNTPPPQKKKKNIPRKIGPPLKTNKT